MTLEFNNILKNNAFMGSIQLSLGTLNIKVYPSTIPFPSGPQAVAAPAGFILNFTGGTTTLSNNTIILSGAPLNAVASASGTATWIHIAAAGGFFVTDSLGVIGSANVATLTTLNIVNGNTYQFTSFNLGVI